MPVFGRKNLLDLEVLRNRLHDGGENLPGRPGFSLIGCPIQATENLCGAQLGNRFHVVGNQGLVTWVRRVGKDDPQNRYITALQGLQ